jgi:predicted transcriptional regulator
MMNLKNIKILLPIPIIALIGILIIVWYSLFQDFTGYPMVEHGICPRMIPNYLLWLSLILMIFVTVPVSYYVISKKLEEKMEKSLNAIIKLVDQKIKSGSNGKNIGFNSNGNVLKLLNQNEKKVVEKIIENRGCVLQSEISKMKDMTKLKTHRAVRELERKGIVELEQYGKTNKISLTKDFEEIILK